MSMQATDAHVVELCKDIPLLSRCGITLDQKIPGPKGQQAKRVQQSLSAFGNGRQQKIVLNGTCEIFGSIYSSIKGVDEEEVFPLTPVQSIEKVATGRAFRVVGPEQNELLTLRRECTMMLANLVGGGKVYFIFD